MKSNIVQILLFLLMISFIISCSPEKLKEEKSSEKSESEEGKSEEEIEMQKIVVESEFELLVPSDFVESKNLNKEAIMQYWHPATGMFIMALIENKKEVDENFTLMNFYREENDSLIDDYAIYHMKNQDKAMHDIERSDIIDKEINGFNARQFIMTGVLTEIKTKVKYISTVIEDDENFYFFIIFCPITEFDNYKRRFHQSIESIQIFDPNQAKRPKQFPKQKMN